METLDANFEVFQKILNLYVDVFVVGGPKFPISDLKDLNKKKSLNSIQPNIYTMVINRFLI
jgi:hypothetical protein